MDASSQAFTHLHVGQDATVGRVLTCERRVCVCIEWRVVLCCPAVQTSAAQSLSLSEDTIFCGCADGTVRAFSSADLHFACTLPRPHPLGCDVAAVTEPG